MLRIKGLEYNVSLHKEKLTIIICIPGNTFSNTFLNCWTNSITTLSDKYKLILSNGYSSHVNFARAMCLGANVLHGPEQHPFNGKTKYDAIIWLDSDMVFTPFMLDKLIYMTLHKYKVCSGIYAMDGGNQLCCVKDWDMEYYKENGGFEFISVTQGENLINQGQQMMKCAYVGMGCMGIRYGILEDTRFKYPWFFRNIEKIGDNIVDGSSEDVSFIRNMIDSGVIDGVMVDLSLRFGHEKRVVY